MEMGQCRGRAQTQWLENLNRAASEIYHEKDCLCQEEKWQSWTNGDKKAPSD